MSRQFERLAAVVGLVAGGLTIAGKFGWLNVPAVTVGPFSLTQGFNSDSAFAVGALLLVAGMIYWKGGK